MSQMETLREAVLSSLRDHPLAILDIGAGRQSAFRIDGARLVGLDPSPDELALNPDLDESVVGGIEDTPLPAGPFHIAVLWDVLEHLNQPWDALSTVTTVLSPGGLIVIAAPDPLSMKGLVTKLTPLALHRLVLQRIMPFVDREPFPTYLRFQMRPTRIRAWAHRNGFDVVFFAVEEGLIQKRIRDRLGLRGRRWRVACALFKAFTLGQGSAAHTDYKMVLRRRSAPREDSGNTT
jgi:SAM-dependent methyltransferase